VNRKKRKDAYKIKSLDAISELVNDNTMEIVDREDELKNLNIDFKMIIKNTFLLKDYFMAYMIDCILNENVFYYSKEKSCYEFNIKKLSRVICNIDESYCVRFADTYELDREDVIKTLKYFDKLNSNKLLYKIEYSLQRLKHDETILKQLKGKN
jgi:hypothetical protein